MDSLLASHLSVCLNPSDVSWICFIIPAQIKCVHSDSLITNKIILVSAAHLCHVKSLKTAPCPCAKLS